MPRNSKSKAAAKRKAADRKPRTAARSKAKRGVKPAKSTKPKAAKHSLKTAGENRAEGIRLFKIAGRPSKQDFITVLGAAGPRMTWQQRAQAGVPAEKFQAALAAKQKEQ
jgi:hypothetical protein